MMKNTINMTEGSLWKEILKFSLPVAATSMLEQLFSTVDIAVVGNFAGQESTLGIAAIGANTPLVTLIINLFIGIALGANVVIANALGRQDSESVQKTVHTAITFSIVCGVIAAVIGELFCSLFMRMFGIPDDVFPYAAAYFRIYLIGMPVILLYNFEAAVFKSRGFTSLPLTALGIGGIFNIFGNLFFVLVLHMNVCGVAIATVCSNAFAALFLFHRLLTTNDIIGIDIRKLRIHTDALKNILRIGLPAGMQSAIFAGANIVVQSAINSLGSVVMAGSSAAYNVEALCYHLTTSFSQACTTFVGHNYGANQLKRCRKILRVCITEGMVVLMLSVGLVGFFGRELIGIFDKNPDVISAGYTRMLIVFVAYIFCVLYENMAGYLRGCGISLAPALIAAIGVCGTRLIWIFAVFPSHQIFGWIMTSYPVSLALTAIMMFVCLIVKNPSQSAVLSSGEKVDL